MRYGQCSECGRDEYLTEGKCRVCSFSHDDLLRIARRIIVTEEMAKEYEPKLKG